MKWATAFCIVGVATALFAGLEYSEKIERDERMQMTQAGFTWKCSLGDGCRWIK